MINASLVDAILREQENPGFSTTRKIRDLYNNRSGEDPIVQHSNEDKEFQSILLKALETIPIVDEGEDDQPILYTVKLKDSDESSPARLKRRSIIKLPKESKEQSDSEQSESDSERPATLSSITINKPFSPLFLNNMKKFGVSSDWLAKRSNSLRQTSYSRSSLKSNTNQLDAMIKSASTKPIKSNRKLSFIETPATVETDKENTDPLVETNEKSNGTTKSVAAPTVYDLSSEIDEDEGNGQDVSPNSKDFSLRIPRVDLPMEGAKRSPSLSSDDDSKQEKASKTKKKTRSKKEVIVIDDETPTTDKMEESSAVSSDDDWKQGKASKTKKKRPSKKKAIVSDDNETPATVKTKRSPSLSSDDDSKQEKASKMKKKIRSKKEVIVIDDETPTTDKMEGSPAVSSDDDWKQAKASKTKKKKKRPSKKKTIVDDDEIPTAVKMEGSPAVSSDEDWKQEKASRTQKKNGTSKKEAIVNDDETPATVETNRSPPLSPDEDSIKQEETPKKKKKEIIFSDAEIPTTDKVQGSPSLSSDEDLKQEETPKTKKKGASKKGAIVNEDETKKSAQKKSKAELAQLRIEHLKKLLRISGIKLIIKKTELEQLPSDKARIDYLKAFFDAAGFTGNTTIKDCQKYRKKRDTEKELLEIQANAVNVQGHMKGGRTLRGQARTPERSDVSVKRKRLVSSEIEEDVNSSDDEKPLVKKQRILTMEASPEVSEDE